MLKKFNHSEALTMKSNTLPTYFSPSVDSFKHFLFLFWSSQSIDLRGIKVAERGH